MLPRQPSSLTTSICCPASSAGANSLMSPRLCTRHEAPVLREPLHRLALHRLQLLAGAHLGGEDLVVPQLARVRSLLVKPPRNQIDFRNGAPRPTETRRQHLHTLSTERARGGRGEAARLGEYSRARLDHTLELLKLSSTNFHPPPHLQQ